MIRWDVVHRLRWPVTWSLCMIQRYGVNDEVGGVLPELGSVGLCVVDPLGYPVLCAYVAVVCLWGEVVLRH